MEETFPDLSSMSEKELKKLISELTDEERELSYRRRLLHGKIDILRADLERTLALLGCASVHSLDGSFVEVPKGW